MIGVQALREEIRAGYLNDVADDIWADSEIENAIYAAEIIHRLHKPSCTATYVAFSCAAGSRQSLAALTSPAAASLLDVDRVGDANTIGDAIVKITRQNLDRFDPAWQQATQVATPREFCLSDIEPLIFYLNPPVIAATSIMLTFSAVPAVYGTVDANTVTTVRSEYKESVKYYALYLLFSKYSEGTVNFQRGQSFLATAGNLLGVDLQMRKVESPRNVEHDN